MVLYRPLDGVDYTELLEEEEIIEVRDIKKIENVEDEKANNDITLKIKIIKFFKSLKKKIAKKVDERIGLEDFTKDILLMLPRHWQSNSQYNYIQNDDSFETTLTIPTNGGIKNTELLDFFFDFTSVQDISIRLIPKKKEKEIRKYETKLQNDRMDLEEKQSKGKKGSLVNNEMDKLDKYLDDLVNDSEKELFDVIFTVSIVTKNKKQLREVLEKIIEEAKDRLGIIPNKARFEQENVYFLSKLREHSKTNKKDFIPMDSSIIAGLFQFTSNTVQDGGDGTFYLGNNLENGSIALMNPSDRTNPRNRSIAILGQSGAGKSTLAKIKIWNSALVGYDNIIIDPTGEYVRIALELGMKIYKIGQNGAKINPFSIISTVNSQIKDVLLPCFSIILDGLDYESGLLDSILQDFYKSKYKKKNIKTFVKFLEIYINKKKLDKKHEDKIIEYLPRLKRYSENSLKNLFGEDDDFNNLHNHVGGVLFDVSEFDASKGDDSEKHLAMIMHIIITNI